MCIRDSYGEDPVQEDASGQLICFGRYVAGDGGLFQIRQLSGGIRLAVWSTVVGSRYNVLVLFAGMGPVSRRPVHKSMG